MPGDVEDMVPGAAKIARILGLVMYVFFFGGGGEYLAQVVLLGLYRA